MPTAIAFTDVRRRDLPGRRSSLAPWQYRQLKRNGVAYQPGDLRKVINRQTQTIVRTQDGDPNDRRLPDVDEIVIPDTQAGLEELLHDSQRMQRVFSSGQFPELITNYARAYLSKEVEIANQVQAEVQKTLRDWLKTEQADGIIRPDVRQLPRIPEPGNATRNTMYNPRAMGSVLDREFADASDYFRTIWHLSNKTTDVQTRLSRVRNAFSSVVPSEGGFLIPEVLRSELLAMSLETAIVRPRARVIPMDSLRVPFPAIDSSSNVNSVYGGIVAYWTEEGATLAASSASFSRIVLDAKKLTAYAQVPNELISDSLISFQALLDQIFPEAIGWYEDDAFLNGNGVGMPLGAFKSAATILVAKETDQAADTIVWENIINMYSRMLPGSLNRAVWLVPPDAFPQLATMALSVGTGGSAIWLNNGAAGPPGSILGRPIIITEKAPKLGDEGDVSFVDFGFYLIGDRQVMSATSSPHYRFGNDETAFRVIERVDGRPWLNAAMTPKNNGPTLSPVVRLAERA
jgi:HK97 family phage major capsid protein